jgi:hypothetical protein
MSAIGNMLAITGSFSPRHVDAENWMIKKSNAQKERRKKIILRILLFLILKTYPQQSFSHQPGFRIPITSTALIQAGVKSHSIDNFRVPGATDPDAFTK